MTALLLTALQRQALLLSLGALLLLALRPLLLKRLGARATYAAWLLLPALLATPLLPRLNAQPLPVFVTATELARSAAAPLLTAPPPDAAWPSLLLAAWLGGAALVLSLQTLRQWRLSRHGARLPAGTSPALVGLWRPLVALPADFEARFAPEERQLILAHEDVHRVRRDNAWNLLACLLTALHWWNPLAWLAARRMQADQELACDAVVLDRQPGALATYTRALLAAHDLAPHGAPLASRWGSTHPLVERIAMLQQPRIGLRRRITGVALLAAIALVGAGAVNALTGDDGRPIDIQVKASLRTTEAEGSTDTREASMTLRLQAGEPGRVVLTRRPSQPTSDQVSIEFMATPLDEQRVLIAAKLQRGDPLVTFSSPRIVTANGVKAVIESGRDDPVVKELLRLEITPTFTARASQPGIR